MNNSDPDGRPDKTQTLAIQTEKRSERRQRRHFFDQLRAVKKEHWVGIGEAVFLIALGVLNFWLLLPFFGQEDTVNYFSAPLIPVLAKISQIFLPYNYGVRLWLLILLLFFPVCFYFWVRELMQRKLPAAIAALLISLPKELFLLGRTKFGLLTDDGAQVASLSLIFLFCLSFLKYLRSGGFGQAILASFLVVLVALTSPFGLIILFGFSVVFTFSEILLGNSRLKSFRFATVLTIAVGLSAFWYHPSFVWQIMQSSTGELIKKAFFNLLPVSFFVFPILGTFGYLVFDNRPQLQPLFLAFFLTTGFGLFSLGAGIPISAPTRFLPAFSSSLAFLIGVLMVFVYDFLRKRLLAQNVLERIITLGFPILSFLVLLMMILVGRSDFWLLTKTQVLGAATEMKTGIWQLKNESSVFEKIFGYSITSLTLIGLGYLKVKLKKLK